MYQASNQDGGAGPDQDPNVGGDEKGGKSDEEVTDVDFEEV